MATVFDDIHAEQGNVFQQIHSEQSKPDPYANLGAVGQNKYVRGALDLAAGAAGSLADHALNVYDLLRKIPGASSVLPDSKEFQAAVKDATPDNTPAHIGKFLENMTEFMVSAGKVEAATRAASLPVRMATQGATGAAVSGVQTGGDPASMAVSGALSGAAVPVGDAFAWLTQNGPRKIYQAALRPTRAMMDDTPGMIDYALQNKIPINADSLAKIDAGIQTLRQDIESGISGRRGATIDPNKVSDALDELRSMYQNSVNPTMGGGVKAIDAVKKQFLELHGMTPPTSTPASTLLGPNGQPLVPAGIVPGSPAKPMGIEAAQASKINTHKLLSNAYGDMKGAEVEATKNLARGLKEQIETVFPEIADLNQSQSNAMGLDEALSRRVWQMQNSAGIPTSINGVVTQALDHPDLYSRIALALSTKGVRNVNQFISDRLSHVAAAANAGISGDGLK